jgi:hypothetical protein
MRTRTGSGAPGRHRLRGRRAEEGDVASFRRVKVLRWGPGRNEEDAVRLPQTEVGPLAAVRTCEQEYVRMPGFELGQVAAPPMTFSMLDSDRRAEFGESRVQLVPEGPAVDTENRRNREHSRRHVRLREAAALLQLARERRREPDAQILIVSQKVEEPLALDLEQLAVADCLNRGRPQCPS